MNRFEGSYLGQDSRISPLAIMECKICWTAYDPDEGDDTRQILPGTPFQALPADWKCPGCDAPKYQFMVREDPGSQALRTEQDIAARTALLVADFKDVWLSKMRDVPLVNPALHVEAIGFRPHDGRPLGVLIAPWFMNLVLLPAPEEDWSALVRGARENIVFPSGPYEFLHNRRDLVGGYKACSLFSPMGDFNSQMQAQDVARAVMTALFDPANREETDRAADIRAAREAESAHPVGDGGSGGGGGSGVPDQSAERPAPPSRRRLVSGGFAQEAPEDPAQEAPEEASQEAEMDGKAARETATEARRQ